MCSWRPPSNPVSQECSSSYSHNCSSSYAHPIRMFAGCHFSCENCGNKKRGHLLFCEFLSCDGNCPVCLNNCLTCLQNSPFLSPELGSTWISSYFFFLLILFPNADVLHFIITDNIIFRGHQRDFLFPLVRNRLFTKQSCWFCFVFLTTLIAASSGI